MPVALKCEPRRISVAGRKMGSFRSRRLHPFFENRPCGALCMQPSGQCTRLVGSLVKSRVESFPNTVLRTLAIIFCSCAPANRVGSVNQEIFLTLTSVCPEMANMY